MNDLSSWKESRCHERSERMCFRQFVREIKENPMFAWGAFVIIILCTFYFIFVGWALVETPSSNTATGWEKLAQFGDSFGALNTLFTGLAFAGLIVTIWLQRHEIKENKIDRDNRNLQELIVLYIKSIQAAIDHESGNIDAKNINMEKYLIITAIRDRENKAEEIVDMVETFRRNCDRFHHAALLLLDCYKEIFNKNNITDIDKNKYSLLASHSIKHECVVIMATFLMYAVETSNEIKKKCYVLSDKFIFANDQTLVESTTLIDLMKYSFNNCRKSSKKEDMKQIINNFWEINGNHNS